MTSPNNETNAKLSTIDAASSAGAFVELLVEFMEQVTLHRKYLETETVLDTKTQLATASSATLREMPARKKLLEKAVKKRNECIERSDAAAATLEACGKALSDHETRPDNREEMVNMIKAIQSSMESLLAEFDVGTEIYKLCDISKPLE